jgi:two-component system, NarL family, nitrate/nitrite response regulator NarL
MDAIHTRAADKIRVLIADNSRIHTQLLSDALVCDPNLNVISWDGKPSTLIPVIKAQSVDVVAISSALHGSLGGSAELIRELRTASPGTRIVVLLDSQKKEDVINAFRAGARGIFSREGSVEMFRKCMRHVHQGEIWADTSGVSLAIEALASAPMLRAVGKNGVNLLSKREQEVVQCLVQGMTNREIADEIGLSQHTVKNYLFRVFDKLGVSSRTELLFMTLNQDNKPDDRPRDMAGKSAESNDDDGETLARFEKAAGKGLPAAQLALAELYLSRRAQPDDLMHAYMWFLVATERAAQTKSTLSGMLTPKQMHEAQQKASARLARMHGKPVLPSEALPEFSNSNRGSNNEADQ